MAHRTAFEFGALFICVLFAKKLGNIE